MSDTSERDQPKTPRTPPERQIEIVRDSIRALERIGHTYAANKQRELLERLEKGGEQNVR